MTAEQFVPMPEATNLPGLGAPGHNMMTGAAFAREASVQTGELQMHLAGFVEPLVANAGSRFAFYVSTDLHAYEVDIVRLRHGDRNPQGPGFKVAAMPELPKFALEGQVQPIVSGSYAVADVVPNDCPTDWTLSLWIWPTLPCQDGQVIVSSGMPEAEWQVGIHQNSLFVRGRGEEAEKIFGPALATKRLYIHDDVYDALAAEIMDYAQTIKIGDGSQQGTDLGPIQNRPQYEKVWQLIDEARASGLRFLLGGERPEGPGYFVPLTIIDNPPDDAPVVTEEAFGPVLPLLRFTEIEDVIRRANDTCYGLAASVWSRDTERAYAIARRLEAGTVWINETHIFSPTIPFGGHKQSGIGLENALEGLAEYTNSKTITVRKLPT